LLALASSVIVGGCGAAAIRAADAKNADRLFTIGGDIYESCSACHQKYLDAIVNANK
jgi:mono/diheme cytochrome c family protein